MKRTNNIDVNAHNNTRTLGNVKLSIVRDGNVLKSINAHNTGTIYLCEYLAYALTGEYILAKRPEFIWPFSKSGVEKTLINKPYQCTESKIVKKVSDWDNYSDQYGNTDGGYCATKLSFIIPGTQISGVSIDGFELRSGDANMSLYAEVELEEPLSVPANTNLLAEWTLYVSYNGTIEI